MEKRFLIKVYELHSRNFLVAAEDKDSALNTINDILEFNGEIERYRFDRANFLAPLKHEKVLDISDWDIEELDMSKVIEIKGE